MGQTRQSRTLGYVLRAVGVIAAIAFVFGYMTITENTGMRGNPLILFGGIALFGGLFWNWGSRHLARPAEEVLAADKRPPVVYLRSFANEANATDAERGFAAMFEPIGPFVAIGAPGEKLPPLGAARLYLAGRNWKQKVSELLRQAELVLVYGGETPGLGWEVSRVRKMLHPSRVTIMVPNDAASYEAFRMIARKKANLNLPPFPGGKLLKFATGGVAGFVSFDDNWNAQFTPLPRAANRGLGMSEHYTVESGRAWAALHGIYSRRGVAVPEPPRNWLLVYYSVIKWYIIIVLIAGVVAAAGFAVLWYLGMVGFDNQTGPYWIR
ncbi:MAG: hypothetical protein ACE5FS_11955 [Paracoccaceae bacterium]